MKTTILPKKLLIKKHTVADLNGNEMKSIQGGITTPTGARSVCICLYTDSPCPTHSGPPMACCL